MFLILNVLAKPFCRWSVLEKTLPSGPPSWWITYEYFFYSYKSLWLNPLLLCIPQAYPVPCDPGQYALVGSLNCTDCPVGMKCPSTQQMPKILCAPGGLMSSYSFLVIFLKWCLFFALFIDKRKKGVNITFNPFHLTLCRLRTTCFDLIICPQLGTRVMTCLLLFGAVFKLLSIVVMQLLWFWFKLVSSLALKGMVINNYPAN